MCKKTSFWIMGTAALLSAMTIIGVEGSHAASYIGAEEKLTTLTLDGTNGLGTTINTLEDTTKKLNDYTTISFKNAKSMTTEEGWFCRLGAGGSFEKQEYSYGMKAFTLTLGIDSKYTSSKVFAYLYNDKDVDVYNSFEVVSGQSYECSDANYFRFVATNIINVKSLVVSYGCLTPADSVLTGVSEVTSSSVSLKSGVTYVAGSVPTSDDFVGKVKFRVGANEYTRYASGNALQLTYNANFDTKGGDIEIDSNFLPAAYAATFNYTLRESSDAIYTEANATNLVKECEDMTLGSLASALKQNGDDYTKEYTDSNCSYGALHAAAYLGYASSSPYACKGSPYGGFVHNFDAKSETDIATMSWTINSDKDRQADFWVRGASNNANRTAFTAEALQIVGKAANFELNGASINDTLDSTKVFPALTSSASDSANRTGTITTGFNTFSLSGRFVYLNWGDLYLGKINLQKGDNTIKIIANNSNVSGHWDECYIRY